MTITPWTDMKPYDSMFVVEGIVDWISEHGYDTYAVAIAPNVTAYTSEDWLRQVPNPIFIFTGQVVNVPLHFHDIVNIKDGEYVMCYAQHEHGAHFPGEPCRHSLHIYVPSDIKVLKTMTKLEFKQSAIDIKYNSLSKQDVDDGRNDMRIKIREYIIGGVRSKQFDPTSENKYVEKGNIGIVIPGWIYPELGESWTNGIVSELRSMGYHSEFRPVSDVNETYVLDISLVPWYNLSKVKEHKFEKYPHDSTKKSFKTRIEEWLKG